MPASRPIAEVHRTPGWQRAVMVLSGTVVGLVVVLGLIWGRPVLIPVAVAALLTFLLNPVVKALERRGLRRVVAVVFAVSTVSIILAALGWIMTRQVAGLVAELPQNTVTIRSKVKALRELVSGPLADRFGQMADEIMEESHLPATEKPAGEKPGPTGNGPTTETVIVRSNSVPWLTITGYLTSALEVLATFAFALVLLVFFMLGRDDLRDRLVLLAGKTQLAVTSKALEDVAERIGRYIVHVALVNGGFGVVLTAGLFVLGVPYALLWGFLAAVLRFIPYIGPWIGAVFPLVMSLATSIGWWQPLAVFGFVMVLELTCNNVIEPFVFGQSTGVSPIALLISAAFWLYLWGPIGLVLSAPIAVCLVVLGKNIPQLGFLHTLLGDVPALRADLGIYQRLLLGDAHDVARLLAQRVKATSPEQAYDELLIPALKYTKRDVQREYLTSNDQAAVLQCLSAVLTQIATLEPAAAPETSAPENGTEVQNKALGNGRPAESGAAIQPVKILGYPAADTVDCAALELLRQLLDTKAWELEVMPLDALTIEMAARIVADPPALICLAALAPGGMAEAVYLCRQLRDAAPDVPILVGRWGRKRNEKIDRARLQRAGATFVTSTLRETRQVLELQLPLLAGKAEPPFAPKVFPGRERIEIAVSGAKLANAE